MSQLIDKQSAFLSLSRMLERAAYYGIRAMLVLYALEILLVEQETILALYGWFTSGVYFCYLIGGLLGSLAFQPRLALLIGGSLQTAGALLLSFPDVSGLYLGGILLALGTGLYAPNMLSAFAHNYRLNHRDLSSGFNLIYLMVNLGAFFGIILLGIVSESYGYTYGFLIAALLMAGSTVLIYFADITDKPTVIKPTYSAGSSLAVIPLMVILTVLFWGVYEISGSSLIVYTYQSRASLETTDISDFIQNINVIVTCALGIGFFFLWHFVRLSDFIKVGIGFALAAIGIFLLSSGIDSDSGIAFNLVVLYGILFSIAEVLISPTTLAIYSRCVQPKYLALILGATFFLVAIGNKIFSAFIYPMQEMNTDAVILEWSAIVLFACALIVIILQVVTKPEEMDAISDSDLLES